MGCHALLQRILPSQGSNPRFLRLRHWEAGSLLPHPLGSPINQLYAIQKKMFPKKKKTTRWDMNMYKCNNLTYFTFRLAESESCSVVSNSLRPHTLSSLWNSPGHSTGVGSLSLLQEIFPIQGLNPGLPHCRWILYQLSYYKPMIHPYCKKKQMHVWLLRKNCPQYTESNIQFQNYLYYVTI